MPISTAGRTPGLLASFTQGETILRELPDLTDEADNGAHNLKGVGALYRDYYSVPSASLLEPPHQQYM